MTDENLAMREIVLARIATGQIAEPLKQAIKVLSLISDAAGIVRKGIDGAGDKAIVEAAGNLLRCDHCCRWLEPTVRAVFFFSLLGRFPVEFVEVDECHNERAH